MKFVKLLSKMVLAIVLATTVSMPAHAGEPGLRASVMSRRGRDIIVVAAGVVVVAAAAYRCFTGGWPFGRTGESSAPAPVPVAVAAPAAALVPVPAPVAVVPQGDAIAQGGLPDQVVPDLHIHIHGHYVVGVPGVNANPVAAHAAGNGLPIDGLLPIDGPLPVAPGHAAVQIGAMVPYNAAQAGALVPDQAEAVPGTQSVVPARALRGFLLLVGYELIKTAVAKWNDSNIITPPVMQLQYEAVCCMMAGVVLISVSILPGLRG